MWVFGSVGSHFGRFFRMLVPILVGFSAFIIFGSVCSNFGIFSLCIYVLDVFQVGLICVKIHRKQPHNPFNSVVQSKYRVFLASNSHYLRFLVVTAYFFLEVGGGDIGKKPFLTTYQRGGFNNGMHTVVVHSLG